MRERRMCVKNNKYSAGILPYAVFNNKVYYLLGQDWRDEGFSDFGGKVEDDDECDTKVTAAREFYEESLGSVLTYDTLIQILQNVKNYTLITSRTLSGNPYYMFLIQIPYVNYKNTFMKMTHFMRYVDNYNPKYFEKNDIRWVESQEMKRACVYSSSIKLRNIFKQTVMNHLMDLRYHEQSVIKPWCVRAVKNDICLSQST
jgi:hypothetical protein